MKIYTVQNIQSSGWIDKCFKNAFGIILPTGWLGRPFDNRHVLSKIEAFDHSIKFVFDDIRSITVYGPIECEILQSDECSCLKFSKYRQIELEWVDYGEESTAKPVVKKYNCIDDKKLELVGYFI